MLTSSPIPKQTVGRTFFYSIITLGVVALVQVGAVCWAIIERYHSTPRDTRVAFRSWPASDSTPPPSPSAGATPQDTSSSGEALVKPTPIPPPPISAAQARLNELLTLARTLSDKGDMSTALIRLREALALAPQDPRVLAELAGAYEKIGSSDKATEYWQNVYNLGKSAGTYYDMAASKLNPPEPADNTSKYDSEGFLPGSSLAIAGITKADSLSTPGKKFSLNVPVKSRPGTQIDVHDVSVYVIFYELLEDGTIAQTTATTSHTWITSPVNWNQNPIQILQVGYTAASLDTNALLTDNRIYFGYIARVYYEGKLQDVRAEPAKLLNQFPAPATLSKEDEQ